MRNVAIVTKLSSLNPFRHFLQKKKSLIEINYRSMQIRKETKISPRRAQKRIFILLRFILSLTLIFFFSPQLFVVN